MTISTRNLETVPDNAAFDISMLEDLVSKGNYELGLDLCVNLCVMPSPRLIEILISKILMKPVPNQLALKVNRILTEKFAFIPSRLTVQQRNGFLNAMKFQCDDLWPMFCSSVVACFEHHNFPVNPVKERELFPMSHPNCQIILNFYIRMLNKFFHIHSDLMDNQDERLFSILKWITHIYRNSLEQTPLSSSLHLLLKNLIRQTVGSRAQFDPQVMYNESLFHITSFIILNCQVFEDPNRASHFLSMFFDETPYFECEAWTLLLYERVLKRKPLYAEIAPFNLKNIVNKFMCLQLQDKVEDSTPELNPEDLPLQHLYVRNVDTKGIANLTETAKDNSSLHRIVMENEYGILLAEYYGGKDLNLRNSLGRTPLLEAILAESTESCFVLLDANADIRIKDCKGRTPLHYAVFKDNLAVACQLLEKDFTLLSVKDTYEQKAHVFCQSNAMHELLEEYEFDDTEVVTKAPDFETREEYAYFLKALLQVMVFYFDIFTDGDKNVPPCDKATRKSLKRTTLSYIECIKRKLEEKNFGTVDEIDLLSFAATTSY